MSTTFRNVVEDDIPQVLSIFSQAHSYQQSIGNIQWCEGYPSQEDVYKDMQRGGARVLEKDGSIVGYVALVLNDTDYDDIPLFPDKHPFCVVHRLAIADRFRGQRWSYVFFEEIEKEMQVLNIHELRIDTGKDNIPIQRMATHLGFEYVGTTTFVWGERLVYKKVLN